MTSDVKVRVLATGLATFPDLSVVCGPIERSAEDPNCVTNPIFLAEVLSPSTETYDRGEKFRHYMQIPSLQNGGFGCARCKKTHRSSPKPSQLGDLGSPLGYNRNSLGDNPEPSVHSL
jgi:Putative restriction endonuclease